MAQTYRIIVEKTTPVAQERIAEIIGSKSKCLEEFKKIKDFKTPKKVEKKVEKKG